MRNDHQIEPIRIRANIKKKPKTLYDKKGVKSIILQKYGTKSKIVRSKDKGTIGT
jgi:hypothetical protein